MSAGWTCFVLSPSPDPEDWTSGGIQPEQLDGQWLISDPSSTGGLDELDDLP